MSDVKIERQKCDGTTKTYGHSCDAWAVIARDGKHYCRHHDPVRLHSAAIEERRLLREKTLADDDAFEARLARKRLEAAAFLDRLSDEELRKIIELGGIPAMIAKLSERKDMP